jgi:hypothetical protein
MARNKRRLELHPEESFEGGEEGKGKFKKKIKKKVRRFF